MAITQTYLNSSIAELKLFLGTLVPKYFASVVYTDNTSVTCKDSDGNTIFTVAVDNGNWTYTAYADSQNFVSKTSSYAKPVYGYVCNNGAMILGANSAISDATGIRGSVVISKTNNNKTGFIISGALSSSASDLYSNVVTGVWGDVIPLTSNYSYSSGVTNHTQTQMFPFVTHCALGEKSYFPNAFFIPVAQTRAVFGELVADGVSYVTNGYWAIKDE